MNFGGSESDQHVLVDVDNKNKIRMKPFAHGHITILGRGERSIVVIGEALHKEGVGIWELEFEHN